MNNKAFQFLLFASCLGNENIKQKELCQCGGEMKKLSKSKEKK